MTSKLRILEWCVGVHSCALHPTAKKKSFHILMPCSALFCQATMVDMCNGRGDASSSDDSDSEPHAGENSVAGSSNDDKAGHSAGNVTDPELHVHAKFRRRCYSLVGSLQYMAPEILSGAGYTASVDLWSVGVLAHILVAGFPPFDIPSQVLTPVSSTNIGAVSHMCLGWVRPRHRHLTTFPS